MFHVHIMELEKTSTKVENDLKSIKDEAWKKEVTTNKEVEEKRLKETTKDPVAK
jgi:hypothetical protein